MIDDSGSGREGWNGRSHLLQYTHTGQTRQEHTRRGGDTNGGTSDTAQGVGREGRETEGNMDGEGKREREERGEKGKGLLTV